MQKKHRPLPNLLPEVFISTSETTKEVTRLVRGGEARKIGPRLYTTNMTADPADVVRRNLWRVVGLLAPGAVIGYRTAFEMGPTPEGDLFLVGPNRYEAKLPGVRIRVIEGPGPLEGDQPYLGQLYLASRPRALLESLKLTRKRAYSSRGLDRADIELRLDRELRMNGEGRLNVIRDAARALAPALGAEEAFRILDGIIGTLLGTRKAAVTSRVAIARAAGEPYDPARLELFQTLHAALVQWSAHPRPDVLPTDADFTNIAFFDAYFSNFIEGTRFEVDEARVIVLEGKIPEARPRDAHDVTGTYALVGNRAAMSRGVRDVSVYEHFEERLRAAHAEILAQRPDKRPGEFKRERNKAGQTTFVDPDDVRGTLRQGFEITRSLEAPFARAAMLMFVLSEVHPFDDGNGRIARAFMNAELVSGGQRRILIPTSFRGDYLTGLRTLSRQAHPDVYIQVLDYAQEYTWRVDFSTYDRALAMLTETGAFEEEDAQSGISAMSAAGDERPVARLKMPPPREEKAIRS